MPDDAPPVGGQRRAQDMSWTRPVVLEAGPCAASGRLRLLVVAALAAAGVAGCAHPPRRRFSPGSASTWPSGRCASTPIRSRIASGSTGSARARAPTSASVNPAAAAAAIEARGALPARRPAAGSAASARAPRAPTTRSPSAAPTTASPRRASSSRSSRSPRTCRTASTSTRTTWSTPSPRPRPPPGPRSTTSSPRCATRSGSASARPGTARGSRSSYKYSAESDYWSHAVWASLSRSASGATRRRVGAFGGFSLDSVGFGDARARRPVVAPTADVPARSTPSSAASATRRCCRRWPSPRSTSTPPTSTAFWPTPTGRSAGHRVRGPSRRSACAPRSPSGLAYYFPRGRRPGSRCSTATTATSIRATLPPGVSADPWGLSASMVEGRIYHQLTRDLEVRFLYRAVLPAAAGVLVRRPDQRRLHADVDSRVTDVRLDRPGARPGAHASTRR